MSLMINQNITALNAWRNLNKTDREMSGVMEKLSSGLRINKAADDPAGLVISEQMRAQVVGLKAAIKNSEKGVSMIQTAEAALDKIHSLLDKMRGLALDSANSATNDDNMLAANQAEIDNILETITRISEMTQYGTKKLLNGDNAVVGQLPAGAASATGATGLGNITLAAGQTPLTLSVETRTAPAVAPVLTGIAGASVVDSGALTPGQYTLTLSGEFESFGAIDVGAVTNVTSAVVTSGSYSGASNQTVTFTVDTGNVNILNVSLDGGSTNIGTIDTTGHSTDGSNNSYTFAGSGLSLQVTLQFGGAMTAGESFTLAVTASTATATLSDTGGTVATAGYTRANPPTASVALGGATFDLDNIDFSSPVSATGTFTVDAPGFEARLGTGEWTTVAPAASAVLADENGTTATVAFGATLTAGQTDTFDVVNNSLVFQIGANQNQTVAIAIRDVAADQLALGVANDSGFRSLADIRIDTAQRATDAIGLIDEAIDQISVIRGNLGAFQANTLEANLDSLRVAAENLQASESVIRDTDMAAEMAQFTKYQIMMQAGTAMLAQANQVPQNLLQLLRG
jgi:flagellin